MDEEIKYINYNDDLINYSDFIKKTSDEEFEDWLSNKSFSSKKKKRIALAYYDLKSRKLTAIKYVYNPKKQKNEWRLFFKGEDNIETLPEKDKEPYEYAAGFFKRQLSTLPTKAKLDAEAAEKEKARIAALPKFTNSTFTDYVGEQYYKGNKDWLKSYRALDERDKTTFKRGTEGRIAEFNKLLNSFEEYVKNTDFNYEGSPYGNKENVLKLINELKTNPDKSNFARFGLNYDDWLGDGMQEIIGYDDLDNPITVLRYYDNLLKVAPVAPADEEPSKPIKNPTNISKSRKAYKLYLQNFDFAKIKGGSTMMLSRINNTWKEPFEEANRIGLINMDPKKISQIGWFISVNGRDSKYGLALPEYPNIVVDKEGKVVQITDKILSDAYKNLYNILNNRRLLSNNQPDLSASFDIDGKKFRVSSIKLSLDRIWQQPVSTSNIYVTPLAKLNTTPINFIMIDGGDKKSKSISINDLNFSSNFKKLVASLLKDSRVKLTSEDIKKLQNAGWLKKGGKFYGR